VRRARAGCAATALTKVILLWPLARRLRGCVVAPTKIIAGLALCLGMRLLPAPGASGDYRSDLAAKAEAMAAAMAPDQPHDVRALASRIALWVSHGAPSFI